MLFKVAYASPKDPVQTVRILLLHVSPAYTGPVLCLEDPDGLDSSLNPAATISLDRILRTGVGNLGQEREGGKEGES